MKPAINIITLVAKSEALKRVKQNLPAYGVVWSWDEICYVNLLDEKMRNAFLKRFPTGIQGIYYATKIASADSGNIDMEAGKYIIHQSDLKQITTTRQFYKYYLHSEDEYNKKMFA